MNFRRFRAKMYRHRAAHDWTQKVRVSFTIAVRIDSIQSVQQRLRLNQVRNLIEATKCSILAISVATSEDEQHLLMCANLSYQGHRNMNGGYGIVSYARRCYQLMQPTGLSFRLLPYHCYHLLPDELDFGHTDEDRALLAQFNQDDTLWKDDEWRAKLLPLWDREKRITLAYWNRLDNEIFYDYEGWRQTA